MKYCVIMVAMLLLAAAPVVVTSLSSITTTTTTRLSMTTESSRLRLDPEEVSVLSYGERALQGAGMATKVRNQRAARGRLVVESQPQPPANNTAKGGTTTTKSAIPKKRSKATMVTVVTPTNLSLSYASALEVLRAYHDQHNDLVLPRRFIVPATLEYPKEWHGIDLPSTVYTMRWWQLHVRQHPQRVAELNTLGFVWERLQPKWNLILAALITYSSLYGDLLVPASFVVPHDDEFTDFPKATWGIKLGKCVYRMRLRHDFLKGIKGATRRSQLNQLCFVWDVKEYVFEKFCAALLHYAKLQQQADNNSEIFEKSLKVPSNFIVPSDSSWPRGLWAYPLGHKCTAVRQKGLYVKGDEGRQARLAEIGFSWVGNASRGWYEVVHAAAIYSQIHQRQISNIPTNYRVPGPPQMKSNGFYVGSTADAWPWPETLWDFPLGQRLKDVRLKGAYLRGKDGPKRRAQLDALGFEWNPKRGRRRQKID